MVYLVVVDLVMNKIMILKIFIDMWCLLGFYKVDGMLL